MARIGTTALTVMVGIGVWTAAAAGRQAEPRESRIEVASGGGIPAEAMDVPGPVHEFLAKRVGKYTTVTRFRPPPTPSTPHCLQGGRG